MISCFGSNRETSAHDKKYRGLICDESESVVAIARARLIYSPSLLRLASAR